MAPVSFNEALQRLQARGVEPTTANLEAELGRKLSPEEQQTLSSIGGQPGAPEDVAQFTGYKKVNVNGIEGVISFFDVNTSQDGPLKMSKEARTALNEFGIEGLVMQDGDLYAQHKDGNQYLIRNTQNFAPDFAAVEAEKERKANEATAKSMLKLAGGAATAAAALATGPVGIAGAAIAAGLTSCGEDTVIDNHKEYTNNTTAEQKVTITTQNYDAQIAYLASLLAELVRLQSQSNADTAAIRAEIAALRKQIADLQSAFAAFAKDNKDFIVAQLLSNEQTHQENLAIIDAIKNNNQLLEYIIEQLTNANADLDKLVKLARGNNMQNSVIIKLMLAMQAELKKNTFQNSIIIKLISEFGAAINDKLATIIANQAEQTDWLQKLYEGMVAINNNLYQADQNNVKLLTAILNKMDQLKQKDPSVNIDLTAVLAKLNEILAAIKDHDVNVKICVRVNVDGKVEFYNPDTGETIPVNEGVNNDLEWLLG